MTAKILTVTSCRIEAARHVKVLPHGHPSRRLHGHSFQITVYAFLPNGWTVFPGDEVAELRRRLDVITSPLNYALLNDTIDVPTDENIARWIFKHLDVEDIERVSVQSTSDQGVDLDSKGHAHVWRRYQFQAAHRLPNVSYNHKCGRMHGHGFEAIVHANQDLGHRDLSVDYDLLNEIWSPLQFQLNFQCLNNIAGLENPTSENISAWLWDRLQAELPELSAVTVYETGSCGANYDGQDYRIWKEMTFDSAVQLKRVSRDSPLARVHGHTFKLRLHLCAPLDQVMGWTQDFGDVKAIFDPIFKRLDHQPLHKYIDIADTDTISLANWIYINTVDDLPSLCRIDLYETASCGAIVFSGPLGPILPN